MQKPAGPCPEDFGLLCFHFIQTMYIWKAWSQVTRWHMPGAAEVHESWNLKQILAPDFFAIVDDALLEILVLRICKLLESPQHNKSGAGKRNISVMLFIDMDACKLPQNTLDIASELVSRIQPKLHGLKNWRNKILAHWDLAAGQGKLCVEPLSPVLVGELIDDIRELLMVLGMEKTAAYKAFQHRPIDEKEILQVLKDAAQYRADLPPEN